MGVSRPAQRFALLIFVLTVLVATGRFMTETRAAGAKQWAKAVQRSVDWAE